METDYECSGFFTPILKEWLSVISTLPPPPKPKKAVAPMSARSAANKELYDFLAYMGDNKPDKGDKPDKKEDKVPLPGQKSIMSFFGGGAKPKPVGLQVPI